MNNSTARRFEIVIDGQVGFLNYAIAAGRMRLLHTEVPPALQGRGLAGQLAQAALEYATREHLRVVPLCPFVQAYLKRHPEYRSLIDDTR